MAAQPGRAPTATRPDWAGAPRSSPERPIAGRLTSLAARPIGLAEVLRALGGVLLIFWGLRFFAWTFLVPGVAAAGLAATLLGVVALAAAFLLRADPWTRRLDAVLLAATLAAFLTWTAGEVYTSPAYGTDEVAFDQAAAQLTLQGQDPYGADLAWSLDAFHVPPVYTTNTLAGGVVTELSYPAGAFLPYLPLLAAGRTTQAAIYTDAAFWALAMLLLWLALPRRLRPIVPILASLGFFVDFVAGGVIDALQLPFLVLALWRWDRFVDPGASRLARWGGPLALGLACSVKQSAWFLVPFLGLGIVLEARAAGRPWLLTGMQYAAIIAAGFLAPNLPFIIWWDPHAWLTGALLPLTHPLVPFGQGVVGLTTYLGLGGGNLGWYTLAAIALFAALLAGLATWYRSLKPLLPVLPVLVLAVPTRSLANYFLFAVPGLLVAATTVEPAPDLRPALGRWVRRIVGAGAVAAAGAASALVVLAIITPPPLALAVQTEHTTGQLQTVDAVTVQAHNTSDHPLQPHFAVGLGPYMSSFWLIHQGPRTLAPGATAQYELWAPNTGSMPSITTSSVLYAFSTGPAALSTARLPSPRPLHVEISPQAVNTVVGSTSTVQLNVQVVDQLNRPVRRSGISVALSQVLYTSAGVFPGETSINGHPEGQAPVSAATDAHGVAHFNVRAVQQQADEVFFQAWIPDPYPHGYSNTVSVRFRV